MGFILIMMGVSGCGKTTIGKEVAKKLSCDFVDADDYHSITSLDKMRNGIALEDQDREVWLEKLAMKLNSYDRSENVVLACSALKLKYRDTLRVRVTHSSAVHFVHLKASFEIIASRMRNRADHFMPENLLRSQYDALQAPDLSREDNCHEVLNTGEISIDEIIKQVLRIIQ